MYLTGISNEWTELPAGQEKRRVSLQERGVYRVLGANGEQAATLSGKFRRAALSALDYPVVGDYVAVLPNADGAAVIQALLPRRSVFLRRAAGTSRTEQAVAANIDTVLICMALNHDFNLRRLERYLAVVWDSGAKPVVVLTKADLCDCLPERIAQAERTAIGAEVIALSALDGAGCARLSPYLAAGQTLALVGSSGVGKSTLVNYMLGEARLKTGGLRNDDKGRHTTTHREMLVLPGGAVVIDTPGMRELGLWDNETGTAAAFADVEALAAQCRFADCTHRSEPGCAVRAALACGELPRERLEAYERLGAESAYGADAAAYRAAKEQRFRQIAMYNKNNRKK
ncbi:MAG: ribosome small subunit-dependent GTPase A [Clostridiales bacterium]|nr:ribosome small subunit-dependent GTPase A [Clostridiales bacterium]